ncbi:plasmid maintenance system killer [Nitrosomonas sp. Is79A3]|uniref:type II toxin-antitoxin system RelE/ParE family toxin n=1 Tax=Nitrosomonas sp. (strain Is79A3) TaxID=261292 RepID=UPI000215D22F
MIVNFKTKKLEKCYCQSSQAKKEFGDQVARKYIHRVNLIKAAKNLDEVMLLPGLGCHALKGNRHGQYTVKLTGFYRLIFTVADGDCLNIALIEEVSKHYDD